MSELERIEKEKSDRNKMVYDEYNRTYDFKKFRTIRAFGDDIRTNSINIYTTKIEQIYLAKYIEEFKSKTKLQHNFNFKKIKEYELNRVMALLKGREMVFKAFKSGIFAILKQSEQSEQSEQTSSNDKHTPSILLHQKLHQQLKYMK